MIELKQLAKPRPEMVMVAQSVAAEKNVDPEVVFHALEAAVEKVAKNKYGFDYDIVATVDRKDGTMRIYKRTTVVADGELIDENGEEVEFNPAQMIRSADANGLEAGEYIDEELLPVAFGRTNFQAVSQIVRQEIKKAEKAKEFEEFQDKEGIIVNGLVKRVEYGSIWVDINGKAEGLISRRETIPRETLRVGDRVRAVILSVKRDTMNAQVLLSRSHPMFLAKLFEAEIPEIYEGAVEVKAVARDPGSRAKVAVMSHESSIDPVGASVGTKGVRIQNIVSELNGEKIDVIEWTPNVAELAVDALAPAKVTKVIVDEEAKKIDAVVADDQLSLAIGRHGQNVRLASQLLGWGIDVMSEDQSSEKRQRTIKERTDRFITALDIDNTIAHLLVIEGFAEVSEIAEAELGELAAIQGFDEDLAGELQTRAAAFIAREKERLTAEAKELGINDDLRKFEGLSPDAILILGRTGIKTLADFADLAGDELLELLPSMNIDTASDLIMRARQQAYGI